MSLSTCATWRESDPIVQPVLIQIPAARNMRRPAMHIAAHQGSELLCGAKPTRRPTAKVRIVVD
jgi:hypothetical protein